MSLDLFIRDGDGAKQRVHVTPDGEILTIQSPYPPLMEETKIRPFRQFLTDDGTSSGSNDMGVNGASVNADFFVEAADDVDRYITSLNFIIAYGTTGQPNEWADGTALSNGSRLFYTDERGEQDIHDAIKSNQDMFRLGFMLIPTAWEVRHVNANNDFGYFVNTDLRNFGLIPGVRLARGTKQRLTMRIRDNAGTDADTFNCIAYGFDRFK